MASRYGSSLTFLLAGFGWLALASFVGLAMLIGLILGTPLPPWLRQFHVHAALVGGVLQLVIGGFLTAGVSPVSGRHSSHQTHPLTFLVINGGTVLMQVGFWLRHSPVVAIAGLLVVGPSLWMIRVAWTRLKHDSWSKTGRLYYSLSFLALLISLMCAGALALSAADQFYGYARLAHIHLGVLGFVLLTLVGETQSLLPQILQVSPASPGLARIVLVGMPLSMAGLIGGFLNGSVPMELASGGLLLVISGLYALNQIRTWLASSHRNHAASDHVLIGTFFLFLTVILGLLVGINRLFAPPVMPFGTLHVVAYTHMTFLGFIMNSALGLLSHQVPLLLSGSRARSNKKRGPYQQRLVVIMDRWRAIQIGGLGLGTIGLALVAALTWNLPLGATPIHATMWGAGGLLLLSILLFLVKLAMAWGEHPDDAASSS
ncbi:MAG: hypothetical protein NZM29_01655 [Nitrospira sp.]|nr:hypothetical protein [Nitrospira sp.]